MIQLAFEPAFDPFHSAFRILRQTEYRSASPVAITRAKILDVYIIEPARCLEIRLSGPLKKSAKLAAIHQPAVYGQRPATPVLFGRMSPMQDAAIQTLVLQGLLDGDAFGQGQLLKGDTPLPPDLASRIAAANMDNASLMSFLCRDLDELPLDGPKGLKDRTGLGEFRYDIV
jgi:hypothetical protein